MSMTSTKTDCASDEIEDELKKTKSTVLKRRVRKLYAAMRENCDASGGSLRQTMVVEVHYDDSNLTSVEIKPTSSWMDEGELGDDRVLAIFGPRGGVRMATRRALFGNEIDYAEKKHAFRKLLRAVRRMM